MSGFTYEFPDAGAFLHTVREVLENDGQFAAASALIGAACEFNTHHQYSNVRWDSYNATLIIRVPVTSIAKFTEPVRKEVMKAAKLAFPSEAGYELHHLTVSPALVAPPEDGTPLNAGNLVSSGPIEHDGLRFRSRTETRIYDELKRRAVLFFPNATAVLGGTNAKREPDFLVCKDGKWGILEVMGDRHHTAANAVQDHDRARLFKEHRIFLIEFYDARRCYDEPAEVVDHFLGLLANT